MLKFTKPASIADLEQAVTDAKAALDKARANHREKRLAFEDAKALSLDSETLDNIAAHRSALEDVQAAAHAVGLAIDAVKAAELALDLARTAPQRAATAKRLNAPADRLEQAIAGMHKPTAALIAALDDCSFSEVLVGSQAAQIFSQMAYNMREALQGGDGEAFVAALRAYADGIVDGSRSHQISETIVEQRRKQLKTA